MISKDFNYTGEWSDGFMTGIGEMTLTNGSLPIKGYFKNGEYMMTENMFKLT